MSQFGDYQSGQNVGHAQVGSFVEQRAKQGEVRLGDILLQPHWNTDYRQLVSRYLAALAEQKAPFPGAGGGVIAKSIALVTPRE
jgi:hypothetical protein